MKTFKVRYHEPEFDRWGQLIGWKSYLNNPSSTDIRAHCINCARRFWTSNNYDTKIVTIIEEIK